MTAPRRPLRPRALRRLPAAPQPAGREQNCGTRCQAESRRERDLLRARLGGAVW